MAKMDYVGRKLDDLAAKVKHDIQIQISQTHGQFSLAGQGRGSNRLSMTMRGNIKTGHLEMVRKMTTLLIALKEHDSPAPTEHLRSVAAKVADELIAENASILFQFAGSPEQRNEMQAKLREELMADTALAIEDARHQIVGHGRPSAEAMTNVQQIINSPGATAQQGRDNLTQVVEQWDPAPLLDAVNRCISEVANARPSSAELEAIRAQLTALQIQLKAPDKKPGFIRQAGSLVAEMLRQTAAHALVQYGDQIVTLLPPITDIAHRATGG
jgi:hypothetical protein